MTSKEHSQSKRKQVYECFIDFMVDMVKPDKRNNPDHIRLDGKLKGSNGKIYGKFKHFGKIWKVHQDTRYLPLELAYNAAMNDKDPFVRGLTRTKKKPKLKLSDEIRKLQSDQQDSKSDYLNIYPSKS